MENEVVTVKMAEIVVVENSMRLKTTLGSCIGLILHDRAKSIGGLAHIMLPARLKADEAVGKYAETAIPALLSRLLKRGSQRSSIRAYLAGGADMFRYSGDRKIATVGEKNVDACKRILEQLRIPIVFEDIGGEQGRTVLFENQTASIQVRTLARVGYKGEPR